MTDFYNVVAQLCKKGCKSDIYKKMLRMPCQAGFCKIQPAFVKNLLTLIFKCDAIESIAVERFVGNARLAGL